MLLRTARLISSAASRFIRVDWFGLGAAYRRHLNQQDDGHFNKTDFNVNVRQLTGITVPGRGVVVVPGTVVSATVGGCTARL